MVDTKWRLACLSRIVRSVYIKPCHKQCRSDWRAAFSGNTLNLLIFGLRTLWARLTTTYLFVYEAFRGPPLERPGEPFLRHVYDFKRYFRELCKDSTVTGVERAREGRGEKKGGGGEECVREKKRESVCERERERESVCVCVCVCFSRRRISLWFVWHSATNLMRDWQSVRLFSRQVKS